VSEALPADLVDDVRRSVTAIVGAELNHSTWSLVGGCLRQIDDGAKARSARALKDALTDLNISLQQYWRDDEQFTALRCFYEADGNDPVVARAMAERARAIHIPECMVTAIRKLGWIRRDLARELRREPTLDELAEEIDISPENLLKIQQYARKPIDTRDFFDTDFLGHWYLGPEQSGYIWPPEPSLQEIFDCLADRPVDHSDDPDRGDETCLDTGIVVDARFRASADIVEWADRALMALAAEKGRGQP
jgi:hypothetical protein